MTPIRVLIVDDSAVVRNVLRRELSKESDIEVIGAAPDPFVARNQILKLKPDVLILDVEMPRMDGLTFLRKIMKYQPMPVIIVSSLTQSGGAMALEAYEAGAFEVFCKPGSAISVGNLGRELGEKIREAARAGKRGMVGPIVAPAPSGKRLSLTHTTHKVVAIGSSTGGTEALKAVVPLLPAGAPGVVIVQHMPPGYTHAFAQRLNDMSEVEVREAKDGDSLQNGMALLAPGDQHMVLRRSGANYIVRLNKGPEVHYQRPAVDVLFQSVATYAGNNAIGVVLTGMGSDGADGLLAMREAGASTLAQDEATSVVYGMPRAAAENGGAQQIYALGDIAAAVLDHCARKSAVL